LISKFNNKFLRLNKCNKMPIITLLIPTRERAQLLRGCLQTCLGQDWNDCELLISDNYSSDETREVVDSFADRLPIRYINPGKRLGMGEHWEFAIPEVKSEYMMVIGDDDGLPSQAIARMKALLKSHPNADAICWPLCYFYYPDIPSPAQSGKFYHYCGKLIQKRPADLLLRQYLAGNIYFYHLPGIYHRVARTSLVHSVIAGGIKGIAPDIAIACAMLPKLNDYIFTKDPLSIPGISSHSNGFSVLSLNGNKDRASIFLRETSITIAEPFNNLPIPIESNVNLMLLEVIIKLRREGVIDSSLHIDHVRFVQLARREAARLHPEKKDLLDDNLWHIHQSLCYETGSVCLTRDELFLPIDWRGKGNGRWGHGDFLDFRLSHDYSDIGSAMPIIEHYLAKATMSFTSIVRKILPEISEHLRKRQIAGVFVCLTELECSCGSDLLHLALSPLDLVQFLLEQFPDKDAADHAFSLAYSYYLVFEHIDVDSDISTKLKAISMDLDPVRFRLFENKLLSINWAALRSTYIEIWPKVFKLRSIGLQGIIPLFIRIKKMHWHMFK
jgi:glycosyltransferase involved in cell wall biosynthesis